MAYGYVLQADYGHGHGWEDVLTEYSMSEAKERKAEYEANMPQYPYRIVKRKEKD